MLYHQPERFENGYSMIFSLFAINTLALYLPTQFSFFLFCHLGDNLLCFKMSFDPSIFFHLFLFLYCFDYFLVSYMILQGQNSPNVTGKVEKIWAWGSNLKESLPILSFCVCFKEERE